MRSGLKIVVEHSGSEELPSSEIRYIPFYEIIMFQMPVDAKIKNLQSIGKTLYQKFYHRDVRDYNKEFNPTLFSGEDADEPVSDELDDMSYLKELQLRYEKIKRNKKNQESIMGSVAIFHPYHTKAENAELLT